jgi:hypothetical protein
MKSLVGNIGTLALVAMAGFAVAACSSSIDTSSPSGSIAKPGGEHVGSIGLQLQPVFGVTVTSVHYIVTAGNPALTPAPAIISEGNLPTPGTGSNFSFGIPLPVGNGYYISLSGVDSTLPDTIKCTGSYGAFNVNANQSSQFNMTLTCTDITKGQVLPTIDVKTDACPHLIVDYAVAEPSTQDVGKDIAVHSAAHDTDNAAEVITYAWSIVDPANATKGQFNPATAHDTLLACKGGGDAIKIKVTATNHQCSKSLETVISCKNVACGNGIVEAALGETCDPAAGAGHPADPTCPADCTKVCGDGNAEGDETCDPLPLNPSVCLPPGSVGACTLRVASCGDGFLTAPEKCDGALGLSSSPPGSTCSADCKTINEPLPVKCGDGVTASPEGCDEGTGTNASPVPVLTRNCSNTCVELSTAACTTCEQAGDCFASSDNCLGNARTAAQGGPFTAAEQVQCFAVTKCIRESNCLDGAGTLGKCYCGSLSTAACGAAPYDLTAAGAPNGPCAAVMQAGNTGLTTNSAILGGLVNKTRPAGAAGQRLNCDKTDAACAPICGVQ